MDILYDKIYMSSKKPTTNIRSFSLLHSSRSSDTYKRKRIRERVNPYRTPYEIPNLSISFPWIIRVVVRSIINELTYRTIYLGRPFFRRISRSLIGCTTLYALVISSERRVATCFGDTQTIYICSVRSLSAISVDRFVRAPIYVSRRRWYSLTAF
jgi:hypothetical protein